MACLLRITCKVGVTLLIPLPKQESLHRTRTQDPRDSVRLLCRRTSDTPAKSCKYRFGVASHQGSRDPTANPSPTPLIRSCAS